MAWKPFRRRPSWDGLTGEKALTGSPTVVEALSDRMWQPMPLLGAGARDRIRGAYNTAQSANYAWLYTNSPALRTVVDVISRNAGQLDLRLYEEISEAERQPRPDHPAALSLRYPSEDTTCDQFIRSLLQDRLVFGNAYALLRPAARDQISLFRLPAHMVEIRGSQLFQAEEYRFYRADGTFKDFLPSEILHWRTENPHDPRIGLSPLDSLRSILAEEAALQQAIVELANSGMTEPVWAFRPADAALLEQPTEAALEEDLTNRLYRKNRRVVVTQEGTELRSFGVSPRDAQTLEIRRWILERVAAQYGVPLGMVGLDDNLKEAQDQFYADTLPPYCEELTRFLNHRILVRVYGWTAGAWEFNLDEKHMGNDRLKALTSASGRPVMLTNEARARVNLPPVDGGDELVTPANVIVGDNPKPSVDVMPVQDPNGPEQDGSYREQALPPTTLPAKAETYERLPIFHPRLRAEHERQLRNIDMAQAVVARHFTRLRRSLTRKADGDWDRWDREFTDDLRDHLERVMETEGGIYVEKLGGADFDLRRVQAYAAAMAEGVAVGVNETVRREIDEVGIDEALGRSDRHVASVGASVGAGATTWARIVAAEQSPGYEQRVKRWVPNTNRHASYGGQTVGIKDSWPAGFAPGTAPGCKCSMVIE